MAIGSSVQVSRSVMSSSLQPHGLQHALLPCPVPTHRTCSNSWHLSQWCHPMSSSFVPFSFYLQSSPASGCFLRVSSSHPVAKELQLQLQHWSFQWILRNDINQNWLVWSPCSPRDSQQSSPTPQLKSINSLVLSFLYDSNLIPIHDY